MPDRRGRPSVVIYSAITSVAGRVKVKFDGVPIKYAQSPASWTFCTIGDAGQTVRGVPFACVIDAQLYVHDRDGVKYQHATGCRVVNDTYMECRSPGTRHESSAVNVATTPQGIRISVSVRGIVVMVVNSTVINICML